MNLQQSAGLMDFAVGSIEHKARFMDMLSKSLGKSFGGSMNRSLNQPAFLEAYYNFQHATGSPMKMGTPGKEHAYFSGLENQFCKDYSCCGLQLDDMHELIQHFEENHVVLESDMDEDDDLQFQFENNGDVDMMDVDYDHMKQSVVPTDIYHIDSAFAMPAFETSIIRKRTHESPPHSSWKQNDDSPPQTFPLTMDGPTKYINSITNSVQEAHLESASEDIDSLSESNKPLVQETRSGSKKERDDRPYKCKVPGCAKAYKNPGGLKYHMHHGHCEDTGDPEMNNIIHKPYQCTVADCGKRYKNLNGLKYHIEHAHSSLLDKSD